MPFRIQRVPKGLNELLSIFGGATPVDLEDRVRTTLDLLQMYGGQQRQVVSATNAAVAEGTNISLNVSATQWFVLFDCSLTIVKTATVTALRGAVGFRLNADVNQEVGLASEALGPFGATETGSVSVIYSSPYPRILPPNTQIIGRASIIGTDATASLTLGAHVGLIGP